MRIAAVGAVLAVTLERRRFLPLAPDFDLALRQTQGSWLSASQCARVAPAEAARSILNSMLQRVGAPGQTTQLHSNGPCNCRTRRVAHERAWTAKISLTKDASGDLSADCAGSRCLRRQTPFAERVEQGPGCCEGAEKLPRL